MAQGLCRRRERINIAVGKSAYGGRATPLLRGNHARSKEFEYQLLRRTEPISRRSRSLNNSFAPRRCDALPFDDYDTGKNHHNSDECYTHTPPLVHACIWLQLFCNQVSQGRRIRHLELYRIKPIKKPRGLESTRIQAPFSLSGVIHLPTRMRNKERQR